MGDNKMEMKNLFKGIAVVIDNEINNRNANIQNILGQIRKNNIPYLLYQEIPPIEVVENFQNLSFVLLDWDLYSTPEIFENIIAGVRIPSGLKESEILENINFITKIKSTCYCPIFIFSDLDVETIKNELEQRGVYSTNKQNQIFVKAKSELRGRTKLFTEIKKWVNTNPSIYILKEWENGYQNSKNRMFSEFQELSSVWPRIMWKTFGEDGVNQSQELGELINRNLYTRMKPFNFSDEVLSKKRNKIEKQELIKVLEGERFLPSNSLHSEDIAPGDVFQISQKKYLLNIRAACDLIPDRDGSSDTIDDIELYLITGSVYTDKKRKQCFSDKYGHFSEIDNQIIIFPLLNGKAIDFRFKKLEIKPWSEIKNKRIGRLLPPFINRVQQKYSHYIQRQGLPRTPSKAI